MTEVDGLVRKRPGVEGGRQSVVLLRLTDEEHERIRVAAKAAGMTGTCLIAEAALAAAESGALASGLRRDLLVELEAVRRLLQALQCGWLGPGEVVADLVARLAVLVEELESVQVR